MVKNRTVEDVPEHSGVYKAADYDGIAWRVVGWELEPIGVWNCQDCGAWGIENRHGGGRTMDQGERACEHENIGYNDEPEYERTGRLVCVMVGDDRPFLYAPADLTEIGELEYCAECGQIGCRHDGRERG